LKDAVRLLIYLLATLLLGALLAPVLYWLAHSLGPATQQVFGQYDFETFFHRSLLIAALILFWPVRKMFHVQRAADLELERNTGWKRDLIAGFLIAAIPLLCCAAVLLWLHVFSFRPVARLSFLKVIASSVAVPLIEEAFFRGLVLGLLLRTGKRWLSIFITSAFYSIVHFLKNPEQASATVTWLSGFESIAHSFVQFADPFLVAAGFTTLFLIGVILADARLLTRSLWLPIGLHAGWILISGLFSKIAHREVIALPWLGRNLVTGIVPLLVVAITWLVMRGWFKYVRARTH
jgi:uncharacterized protein